MKNGQNRSDVKPGTKVNIILKAHQRTGEKTEGIVKDLLTNASFHPHGIKVRLEDDQIGRVCDILEQ
ncbi:YwbE family protein [Paenisporosarcina cavernae]|uniref:YwbE family protein n=1 Tax=Paenisporosarcina cavernae TaxID=2320858 RepID=A0A385YVY0_9BACL|nr:YwbE family protein [Paenisporosarcina cavernae]AYC30450.1 YwbE family protein [Paenisporosarcina cavernae]